MTKYGLVWEDHPEPILEELKAGSIVVSEYEDKRIVEDEDKPQNLLIEGDNLLGLMLLKEEGVKVDVIYIDPPYNTGNEFVYDDKIVDDEDGYRHSKWLSFMSKRLELAYDLLSEDGVIFVSIDDNEQANLKLLMDKIFGEINFIENFLWLQASGNNNSKLSSNRHEYVMSYSKNIANLTSDYFEVDKKGYELVDKYMRRVRDAGIGIEEAQKGLRDIYRNNEVSKGIKNYNRISEDYRVYRLSDLGNPGRDMHNNPEYNYELRYPDTEESLVMPKRGWLYKKRDMLDKISNNEIYLDSPVPQLIRYLDSVRYENMSSYFYNTDIGSREISSLGLNFDYPKPVSLVRMLISAHPNPNATVLDFFAGSGTTAQAVMELNEEDGGNRQFILMTNNEVEDDKVFDLAKDDEDVVQLLKDNEISLVPHTGTGMMAKNKQRKRDIEEFFHSGDGVDFFNSDVVQDEGICRKVTYERIRRVIEGDYANPRKNDDIQPLPNNLSYYKLDVEQDYNLSTLEASKRLRKVIGDITSRE